MTESIELRYAGTEWQRKRPHDGLYHVVNDSGLAVCGVGPLTGGAPEEPVRWRGRYNRPPITCCERCVAWLQARGRWPERG